MFDLEDVKNKIFPALISKSQLGTDIPYLEVVDLAEFYNLVDHSTGSCIPITFTLLKNWDITIEEIHNLAIRNMESTFPGSFVEFYPDMFVLSNRNGAFGASIILDRKFMKRVLEEVGPSAYFLPSSIHEWIIIRAPLDLSISSLESIIRSVNEEVVLSEERLGEHVYHYTENGLQFAKG